MKKLIELIKNKYVTAMGVITLFISGNVLADNSSNPFPSIDVQNGDVVKAVGTHMEDSMRYSMVGAGIIMLLVGIGVIMHRLREDSSNKDTSSFITTLVIAGLAITVGIILISIGWSASNYQVSS